MHCIACKENIKQDALKCPHCQQVQTRSANLVNTPHGNMLIMIFLAGFIIWIIYGIYVMFIDEKLDNQLIVGDSSFNISNNFKGTKINCYSSIKNSGTVRWENISLQAEFFDQKNQLIDIHYNTLSTTSIYPTFSVNARVSGILNDKAENYNSCKISLLDATSY